MNLEWIRFLKVSKESLESIGQHALINKKNLSVMDTLTDPNYKNASNDCFYKV